MIQPYIIKDSCARCNKFLSLYLIQENQNDSDSAETGITKEDIAILGLTQDITGDTQSAGIDKTIEPRRTSTRNKKTPSIKGNDFLWETGLIIQKMV